MKDVVHTDFCMTVITDGYPIIYVIVVVILDMGYFYIDTTRLVAETTMSITPQQTLYLILFPKILPSCQQSFSVKAILREKSEETVLAALGG